MKWKHGQIQNIQRLKGVNVVEQLFEGHHECVIFFWLVTQQGFSTYVVLVISLVVQQYKLKWFKYEL